MDHVTVEKVELGETGLQISPLGLGAWQWGDRMVWDYGKTHSDADLQQAFEISLQSGVNWVDTAEVYGMGRSERLLGQFAAGLKQRLGEANSPEAGLPEAGLLVATKFFPFPWRLSKGSLRRALRASLERLDMPRVDLYQVHWPLPFASIETWMEAMADAVQAGLTQAIGVSNYDVVQTRRAYYALKRRNCSLASNQVRYSLLDRSIETSGLLALCQELKVTLIAYSPLAQGLLTGKYTPANPPPGMRGRQHNRASLERLQPLISLMREIGDSYGGKTAAQVALNWIICKGAVAIPGAKNVRQAQENAGALGWRMSPEEVSALDAASVKAVG